MKADEIRVALAKDPDTIFDVRLRSGRVTTRLKSVKERTATTAGGMTLDVTRISLGTGPVMVDRRGLSDQNGTERQSPSETVNNLKTQLRNFPESSRL